VNARLVSVNVTAEVIDVDGSPTGIDKRSVRYPVEILPDAVSGDRVLDRKHHGGPDKAVYAYASEDAHWWSGLIGATVEHGRFGENLTTAGLDISNAVIGERWHIGGVVLEVAQPRIPCRTFAGFWDREALVREFTVAARPGAYLRVVQTGSVAAGDAIEVMDVPEHGVTVAEAFRARTGERSLVPLLLRAKALPESWQVWARSVLGEGHGQGS